MALVTHLSDKSLEYRGPELRPHFLLERFGLRGSAIGAFIGPCRVETEHLVDWEDKLASDRIEAREMVHFLGEFFGMRSLTEGVLIQRLFMAMAGEALQLELADKPRFKWRREGDDLYVSVEGGLERKLSVSIVTASPVSLLLHAGINIDPTGAPVPAIGLGELGVEPRAWAQRVLERFQAEWESLEWACTKVKPVI